MSASPPERFTGLFDDNFRDILAFALRRTGDPQVAADVAAETFAIAWQQLAAVPKGRRARLWLFGVARNVAIAAYRTEQRQHRVADVLRNQLVAFATTQPDTELAVSVRDALDTLDPLDKDLIVLTVWHDMSTKDAATAVGLRSGTARVRLHRARQRLRTLLGDSISPTSAREDHNV